MESIIINATFDQEARVWVAVHETLGLATEAETSEVLMYKLQELIPELAVLNNIALPDPPAFTVEFRRTALAFA